MSSFREQLGDREEVAAPSVEAGAGRRWMS